MRFHNVCLEAVAYTLPREVVASEELEARLEPAYRRLRLSAGRLELMTGIRQRRFWPAATLPGEISRQTAARLLEMTGLERRLVGALVHGSVCRDYLEPATACRVHHGLGLPAECLVYDVSNACLGILNGIVQVAAMIELGQIRAGIVVGTEDARPLVENTIRTLNADASLTREALKRAMASLTIGSASAAVLLVDKEISRTGNRLLAATARAHTAAHELCVGQQQAGGEKREVGGGRRQAGGARGEAGGTLSPFVGGINSPSPLVGEGWGEGAAPQTAPLMQTDSEALLHEGIAAGAAAFDAFLAETGWTRDELHKTCCHQVGSAHRKLLLETLSLEPAIDFATYETLGNTGSAALPVTLAMAIESGHVQPKDHAALLGIGSGINVLMLALDWQKSLVGEQAIVSSSHARANAGSRR